MLVGQDAATRTLRSILFRVLAYSRTSRTSVSWAMIRISPRHASAMKRRAVSSSTTRETRSSVWRHSREASEVTTMAAMNNAAFWSPSCRSTIVTAVVYVKISATTPKATVAIVCPRRRADRVTATVAEVIKASTPVA